MGSTHPVHLLISCHFHNNHCLKTQNQRKMYACITVSVFVYLYIRTINLRIFLHSADRKQTVQAWWQLRWRPNQRSDSGERVCCGGLGLTKGRAACHMLIRGIHRHLCMLTVHKIYTHTIMVTHTCKTSDSAWITHISVLGQLCRWTYVHTIVLSVWLTQTCDLMFYHTCSSAESPHTSNQGPLGSSGTSGDPLTHTQTCTAGRMENIKSSSKPSPFPYFSCPTSSYPLSLFLSSHVS